MNTPYSNQSEQAVIGSLIIDNNKLNSIIRMIAPDDFYNQAHRDIYQSIFDLNNSKSPFDIVTLSEKGHDIEYLASLTNNVTTAENITHYAKIVKAKAIRRKYIEAAQEVQQMAMTGEYESITEFKSDVLQKMDIEINENARTNRDLSYYLMSSIETIERRAEGKDESKLKYGFRWIDKVTGGAKENELTVLAARPSIGKTSLALQIALNMAMKGNDIAIFSLEMGADQLSERLIANMSKVDSNKIRTGIDISYNDWTKIAEATKDLSDLNINIFDDIFKIEEIRAECRELKNKKKLDIIFIDYLQLCDTTKKCANNNERVSHMTRFFKMLNKELRVPIILLSQLSRPLKTEAEGRRPKLTDLRDSGGIEQDADNAFFLHDANYGNYAEKQEETDQNNIEFIIAKQRGGMRDIYTEIRFIKQTQRWISLENGG